MSGPVVIAERLKRLDEIELRSGKHKPPDNGLVNACAMEVVGWLAGEKWSDHPECVSPVLSTFVRSWNDSLDNKDRQMLKAYLSKLIGTNDRNDEQRAWMLTDWLARVCAPAWLELAGVKESPAALRALPPITKETAAAAQPALVAARGAARAAAWSTAWSAEATANTVAWDAAGAAARDAARDVAWDAARAAARSTAWSAEAAARDAARDAARAATEIKLEPTKVALQQSALELLDAMVTLGSAE